MVHLPHVRTHIRNEQLLHLVGTLELQISHLVRGFLIFLNQRFFIASRKSMVKGYPDRDPSTESNCSRDTTLSRRLAILRLRKRRISSDSENTRPRGFSAPPPRYVKNESEP